MSVISSVEISQVMASASARSIWLSITRPRPTSMFCRESVSRVGAAMQQQRNRITHLELLHLAALGHDNGSTAGVELRPPGAPDHLLQQRVGVVLVALARLVLRGALDDAEVRGQIDALAQRRGRAEHLDVLLHEQLFAQLPILRAQRGRMEAAACACLPSQQARARHQGQQQERQPQAYRAECSPRDRRHACGQPPRAAASGAPALPRRTGWEIVTDK